MKAIIIDDEENGIDALAQLIRNYCEGITVVATAQDIDRARELIDLHQPEVIFLDIEMPGGSGFQLIEQYPNLDFKVIFVTAHHEHAIRALRSSALDYLLKPVKIEELQQAVEKLRQSGGHKDERKPENAALPGAAPFDKIILSSVNGLLFIRAGDILYCEADENYTNLYMKDSQKHTVSRPLKEVETTLDKYHFFRIHKSYLINLDHVNFVNKDSWVIMCNQKELPVSFRKRADFFSLLKGLDQH